MYSHTHILLVFFFGRTPVDTPPFSLSTGFSSWVPCLMNGTPDLYALCDPSPFPLPHVSCQPLSPAISASQGPLLCMPAPGPPPTVSALMLTCFHLSSYYLSSPGFLCPVSPAPIHPPDCSQRDPPKMQIRSFHFPAKNSSTSPACRLMPGSLL